MAIGKECLKYYEEAKGNRSDYMALVDANHPDADASTRWYALMYFQQFDRENRKKQCVCKTAGELVNFLKNLPSSHMTFALITGNAGDVESGYLSVEVDPSTKTIQLVGSIDDM